MDARQRESLNALKSVVSHLLSVHAVQIIIDHGTSLFPSSFRVFILSEGEMRVYEHLLLAHLEVEYVFIGGHLDLLERNLCLHLQTIVIGPTKCMTAV